MNQTVVHSLVRSRRRTLALHIMPDARLVVRAPLKLSEKEIHRFIQKKSAWIVKTQKRIRELPQHTVKDILCGGDSIYYLGERYRLGFANNTQDDEQSVILSEAKNPPEADCIKEILLRPSADQDDKTEHQDDKLGLLKAWYKKRAMTVISERVNYYAEHMGCYPSKIRISNAKRRWGSCSSKGSLNFSWRLVMVPLFVLDSVVVHELAHLSVRNHSHKFWDRVKKYFPEYKKTKKWLRGNSRLLEL